MALDDPRYCWLSAPTRLFPKLSEGSCVALEGVLGVVQVKRVVWVLVGGPFWGPFGLRWLCEELESLFPFPPLPKPRLIGVSVCVVVVVVSAKSP